MCDMSLLIASVILWSPVTYVSRYMPGLRVSKICMLGNSIWLVSFVHCADIVRFRTFEHRSNVVSKAFDYQSRMSIRNISLYDVPFWV